MDRDPTRGVVGEFAGRHKERLLLGGAVLATAIVAVSTLSVSYRAEEWGEPMTAQRPPSARLGRAEPPFPEPGAGNPFVPFARPDRLTLPPPPAPPARPTEPPAPLVRPIDLLKEGP
ncbi:MAG: hypothetical protein R6V58_02060 [Planctomycetota bacterium]